MKYFSRIVVFLFIVSLAVVALAQTDSLSAIIERAQAAVVEDDTASLAAITATSEVGALEAQAASAQARQSQSIIRLENADSELVSAEIALDEYWVSQTLGEKLAILSAYSASVAIPDTPIEPSAPVEPVDTPVDPNAPADDGASDDQSGG